MSPGVAGASGCLLPPGGPCFQGLGGLSSAPSLGPLRGQVHPPLRSPHLQSSLLLVTCLTWARHLPWGSSSHSRHERTESTCRQSSHDWLRFALSVSHALDDFLLPTPCGLVSSHCHVRDSHLRGFPRCQADAPLQRAMPSCRSSSFSSRRVTPPVPDRPVSPSGL
jgi:hypothetical protein